MLEQAHTAPQDVLKAVEGIDEEVEKMLYEDYLNRKKRVGMGSRLF